MALATFTPPVDPSPGTDNTPEFKIKEAQFGDGYTQVTRDGLNHIRDVVNLRWDVLTPEQADTIEAFIVGKGGDTPFKYALRGDTTRQWTCKRYSRSRGSPNTMTAEFRENFSIVTSVPGT
jgi:phage-related protein